MEFGSLGIRGLYNIEIGERQRGDVRTLYEETLNLVGLPDVCPNGHFSVLVWSLRSPSSGVLTFGGSGAAVRAIALAVPRGALPGWRARLLQQGTRVIGRAWQFDEEYLCFVDDSEFDLAITEVDVGSGEMTATIGDRITGIHSVEIDAGSGDELERLFLVAGLRPELEEGPIIRYRMEGEPSGFAIDLFRSPTGSLQHELPFSSTQRVSFEVSDPVAIGALESRLRSAGFDPVPFCDTANAFLVRPHSRPGLEIGFIYPDASKQSFDVDRLTAVNGQGNTSPGTANGAW